MFRRSRELGKGGEDVDLGNFSGIGFAVLFPSCPQKKRRALPQLLPRMYTHVSAKQQPLPRMCR